MFKAPGQAQGNSFKHLPNPYNGYDASSSPSAMKPTAANILENFWPDPAGLLVRDGFVLHHTILGSSAIKRLHNYASPLGGESLWATTNAGIVNVTTAGSGAAVIMALTEGKTYSTAIATGAGNYLMLVNGVDTAKLYDGTTWTSILTFGATSTVIYSYIETYRQRIFLVKRNSTEIEYLASNSIGGATTSYPLGALFRRGGYIVAMSTWTVDGGIGPEDNLCVMTNKGEVAVFAGSDPATWALRGVYFAGRPLGNIPMYKYGGDVLLLTESGVIPMSSLIQSASIDRTQTVSSQIRPFLITSASLAFSAEGWQITSDPLKPYLLVNIPITPVVKQALMQSQTGAWTTYTGWDAMHFMRMNGEMYFAGRGSNGLSIEIGVYRITGASDGGVNITATMLQSYNMLGLGQNKKIEMVKPFFKSTAAFTYNMGVASDFDVAREYTQVSPGISASAGIWGTSLFGAALWTGGQLITSEYQEVPDDYSQWKALYLQVVSRLGSVRYLGSDMLYKIGRHF